MQEFAYAGAQYVSVDLMDAAVTYAIDGALRESPIVTSAQIERGLTIRDAFIAGAIYHNAGRRT